MLMTPLPKDIDTAKLRKYCEARWSVLKQQRDQNGADWAELADFFAPRRGRFHGQKRNNDTKSRINKRLLHSGSRKAWRDASNGFFEGTTSPSRPWFRQTLEDPELADYQDSKLWLAEVQRRNQSILAKSNFYQWKQGIDGDRFLFGIGGGLMLERPDKLVHFRPLMVGQFAIAQNQWQQVDTVYFEDSASVGELARQFGKDALSPQAQNVLARDEDCVIEIMCAIQPNLDWHPQAFGPRSKPWLSIYWETGSNRETLLGVRGYSYFPGLFPRWEVSSNNIWPDAWPCVDAIPDVKALQVDVKQKELSKHLMNKPPMRAPVSLEQRPATQIPGGITYVTGANTDQFAPLYQINPRFDLMQADIQAAVQQIRETMHADLFMMISQLQDIRSATEVAMRKEEAMLMLGPVLNRDHNELLNVVIENLTYLGMQRGIYPEAPTELQGENLEVEYTSILHQAQQAVSTTAMERLAGFAGNLGQSFPEVLDKINAVEMVDEYAERLGVPPRVLKSDEDVEALQRARAQSQQAKEQGEAALAAAKGAELLSKTETGAGQNALQLMLGGAV